MLVAVQEKLVPGVSADTVAVAHPVLLVTADSASLTVNATVTFAGVPAVRTAASR